MTAPRFAARPGGTTGPVELVIFDCDGVLVDTEHLAVRLQIALGAELGRPLTADEVVERFIGRSKEAILGQLTERLGARTAGLWWSPLVRRHREAVDLGLDRVDGLPEALAALTAPVCVASSGSHGKMRRTLGRTGLYPRFRGRTFSASEVSRGKPAPDLFLRAARRMGVGPAACAVVEDSAPGVAAARAAGMRAFGYAGGPPPRRTPRRPRHRRLPRHARTARPARRGVSGPGGGPRSDVVDGPRRAEALVLEPVAVGEGAAGAVLVRDEEGDRVDRGAAGEAEGVVPDRGRGGARPGGRGASGWCAGGTGGCAPAGSRRCGRSSGSTVPRGGAGSATRGSTGPWAGSRVRARPDRPGASRP
ncbi:HAD family hydrolase [Streptomyces omiyaensis]|uniref:HAD family hydrolase n=1 Tax=Streptomyces omiyaensis TaxID=68247 RepID=A0ABW7BU72_9ACTN